MSDKERELQALDTLLAEHRAEVECLNGAIAAATKLAGLARDAALEEAEAACRDTFDIYKQSETEGGQVMAEVAQQLEQDIRALKSQPARRFLDAEEVERVLRRNWENYTGDAGDAVLNVSRDLGLDLGAAPASEESEHKHRWHSDRHEAVRCMECGALRETATVENGLLPAPRTLERCECGGLNSRCYKCAGTGLKP